MLNQIDALYNILIRDDHKLSNNERLLLTSVEYAKGDDRFPSEIDARVAERIAGAVGMAIAEKLLSSPATLAPSPVALVPSPASPCAKSGDISAEPNHANTESSRACAESGNTGSQPGDVCPESGKPGREERVSTARF